MANKINLNEKLTALKNVVDWFEQQEEVDVEQGLEKVKEGTVLIKESKERLSELENEFEKVKKELVENEPEEIEQDQAPSVDEMRF